MQATTETPARVAFVQAGHPMMPNDQGGEEQKRPDDAAEAALLHADKRHTAQLIRSIFRSTSEQLESEYNMDELAALATAAKRVNAECGGVVKEIHDELAAPIKEARKG